MAGYISINMKKTSEVDLVKALTNAFSSLYTASDEKEEYTASVNKLNSMRKSATWRTLDKHQSSLDSIASYYDELCALESKIPTQDIQIPFKWKDAFDKGGFFGSSTSLTLMCVGYEKSCILFNYGAMLTQIAAGHGADLGDDESLKTSTKYFQMAAGVYHHLRIFTQTVTQESLTVDLHPDALSVLYTLCVAQAQECFYHKASKDGRKDSVLAQVASQCRDLYAETFKLMSREQMKALWDKEWFSMVSLKESAFKAVTNYHQALTAKSDVQVGEELARMALALESFKTVEAKMKELVTLQLGDHFLDMYRRANRSYEATKKDNDFIYHARIPDVKQLGTIKPAILAKAIALTCPILPADKRENLFENLLPVSVSQGCQKVEARKNEITNLELAKLKESTQVLNGVLASLNLPAAIEDVAGGQQLPPSIQKKAQEIKEKGGLKALEAKMQELAPQLNRNREIIDECQRLLDEEEQSDKKMKEQFKDKWTRSASENLNKTMRETVNKYRGVIEKAMAADKVVGEKFQSHRYSIVLLGGSESDLSGNIPQSSSGGAGDLPEIRELKKLMEEVDKVFSERQVLEFELKSATIDMKQQFLSALQADGVLNETALTAETLGQALGPLQQRVKESMSEQESLVGRIHQAHREFVQKTGGSGDKREGMLKNLAAAHAAYMDISSNLSEGLKFYGELTNLLLNHQSKIMDFCFARKTEKEELIKDLTSQLATSSAMPSTAPAPPNYQTMTPTPAPSTAPLAGVPQMPYPQQIQGMPQPGYAYAYPTYPQPAPYQVPMPQGYNPYAMPQQAYPPQYPPYGAYPGTYRPPPPPE